MIISPCQIRMARALLEWSQENLAEVSRLSLNTIYNLEKGHISPRPLTVIRSAFENNGVEFVGAHGVDLQVQGQKAYGGRDSRDRFYDDLLTTIKETHCEVAAIFETHTMLEKTFCADSIGAKRMEELGQTTKFRCLLSEVSERPSFVPTLKYKAIPKQLVAPMSVLLYGRNVALIVSDGANFFFSVISFTSFANEAWGKFEKNWETAISLI